MPELGFGEHEFKVGGSFTREWYRRTQELRSEGRGGAGQDYRLYFSNGTPVEALLYNFPFTSENNVNYQGGFIRDNWRVANRLTVNLGVRFERYDVFLPEQSKPVGTFSTAADYPHISLYDCRGLSPRVGVSYALAADNRMVVKATFGRFNHAIRPSNTQILRNLNKNLWPLIESGDLRVLLHATFPLREAAEAHRVMEESSHVGKLVLTK